MCLAASWVARCSPIDKVRTPEFLLAVGTACCLPRPPRHLTVPDGLRHIGWRHSPCAASSLFDRLLGFGFSPPHSHRRAGYNCYQGTCALAAVKGSFRLRASQAFSRLEPSIRRNRVNESLLQRAIGVRPPTASHRRLGAVTERAAGRSPLAGEFEGAPTNARQSGLASRPTSSTLWSCLSACGVPAAPTVRARSGKLVFVSEGRS